MAYRRGSRNQITMLPPSIDEYIAQDAPVRAYDVFVEVLDFEELGIPINEWKVGNSSYHPKDMIKLLIYGYSYGIRSSRKLERATHDTMSFIWLVGGMKPDHKTIAEFRRKNKQALSKILKQCVRMCMKIGLITGNVLFVDGSKIAANASKKRLHTAKWYAKELERLDERIEELLNECEAIDKSESELPDLVSMSEELANSQQLRKKIQKAVKSIEETGSKQSSTSDPESRNMKFKHGYHPGYNLQSVVDDSHGLIVNAETTTDVNDVEQFDQQIDKAHEVLEKRCIVACADSGYANTDRLASVDEQGIHVVVPSQRQALHKEAGKFSKQAFCYEEELNCYRCPEGHPLELVRTEKTKGKRHYRIKKSDVCGECRHFGTCTKSKHNRTIIRYDNEETRQRLEEQYATPASQEIYKKRKKRAELPFGHMKRNLGADYFLLRGQSGAQAESSLLATCFNIARALTVKGVCGLIDELSLISESNAWAV